MNRALLALSALVMGCSVATDPNLVRSDLDRDVNPDASESDLATLTQNNRSFAFSLHDVLTEDSDENFFYSPHSISVALAMTYAGADGRTETEMAEAMRFTLPEPDLHATFNQLDLELKSRSQADVEGEPPILETANSLWGQIDYEFVPTFLDLLAVHYDAGMRRLDFGGDPDGSRETINTWVEDHTEDRIQDLLPEGSITPSTRLVLTNAIYFKGSWVFPFESAQTRNADFATLAGSTVSVPTMQGTPRVNYADYDGYSVVELPFVGHDMAMVLLVPDAGEFATVEDQLDRAFYDTAVAGLTEHDVELALPKFELRTPIDLIPPLRALGMNQAFDAADFSGLAANGGLAITDVVHQGFIAVDEQGAEAAAATAVVLGESAAPQASLTIDRPFILTIVDRPTQALLFVGRITDPS